MTPKLASLWNPTEFPVKLPVFEGPLDLLIFLIRKNEIDIYDIPMEVVTRQYIAYLETMDHLNLEVAGDFFVMASTLMYIKSRMLLPPKEQPPDDEADDANLDPRWELVQQLLEYRRYKSLAGELEERIEKRTRMVDRIVHTEDETTTDPRPLHPVDRIDIWNAINMVYLRIADKLRVGEIMDEPITVSERMEFILDKMKSCERFHFSDLISPDSSLIMVVTTFIAILELTRLRRLRLQQPEPFADIECIVHHD
ncbi:MAG: segregation/condensation protein A [Opitutales bacterium]|nr:segregation/condensation protein A [Opitutales bacterium]